MVDTTISAVLTLQNEQIILNHYSHDLHQYYETIIYYNLQPNYTTLVLYNMLEHSGYHLVGVVPAGS